MEGYSLLGSAPPVPTGAVLSGSDTESAGLTLYHVASAPLTVGENIRASAKTDRPHLTFFTPTPPTDLVRNEDYMARRLVESVFEEGRIATDPRLPSRKSSLFGNPSLEGARFWIRHEARSQGLIYRVYPSISAAIVLVDLVWYNYSVRVAKTRIAPSGYLWAQLTPTAEIAAAAKAYWRGLLAVQFQLDTRLEAIIDGEVLVGEQVQVPPSGDA